MSISGDVLLPWQRWEDDALQSVNIIEYASGDALIKQGRAKTGKKAVTQVVDPP
ncbi:MAG: hypothetical protein ACJA13_001134 [Paraglaciecola sp.]|jgi:hypothetical protein